MPMRASPSVARSVGASVVAAMVLAAGAYFSINNSDGDNVLDCAGTGCTISNLNVVGTLTQAGVSVGGMSFSAAEGIYVNQKGDTMTGALNINVQGGNASTIGIESNNTISGALLYGKRCPAEYAIQYTASGTALAVNSGTTLTIPIAQTLSGYSLARFTAIVDDAGVTGLTRFALRNIQKGKRQIFSTNPSIDTAETSTTTAATAYVINTSNDDVSGGDTLSFDILQIQTGTAPKGLKLYLEFSCP